MSRTYRRRVVYGWMDLHRKLINYDAATLDYPEPPSHDPKSDIGKRIVSRFHGDRGSERHQAPSWFRTLYYEGGFRANARDQLRRAMLDLEYPVIVDPRTRDYWD